MFLYLWYVLIIIAGALVGRRFGRLISLAFMIEMYQVGILILVLIITGRFRPVALIPGVGVLPGIGAYSGVSAGGLVPPLVFMLVAIVVPKQSDETRATMSRYRKCREDLASIPFSRRHF